MSNSTVQTILLAVISVAATVLINTFIVQSCWNYLAPNLFSLPQITFFQAMVLGVGVRSLAGADASSLKVKKS